MSNTPFQRAPLFITSLPNESNTMMADLPPVAYPAQTLLFREGDYGDRIYIVLEGQIAIVKALGTDDERRLGMRGPGEFIGEMSFLSADGLRSASALVHTDALLIELGRSAFDELLSQPGMAYEMLRSVSVRLREANDAAIGDLREKNQRLSEAYAALQAAQAQLIEKERLEHELRLAREIQESMLPQTMPRLAGFECCARMVPAREVGGDFFDLFALDDDTLGIVIGDVCGKGIPAALYMAQTRSMIRAEAFRAASPAEALLMVNRQLLEMNSSGMFVTVVYGQLCRSTRRFVTARAGHEWPLLWDAHGAPIACERGIGHPLGLLPEPAIDVQSITLLAGSTLLLYTDGATEAANPAGDFFGRAGLHATLQGAGAVAAPALCDALLQAVNAHTGLAPQTDDITLVVVRAQAS